MTPLKKDELNYVPEFVMSPAERIIEGSIAGIIVIVGLSTKNYLLAFIGAELLLDSTLLKGQGIGQIKWGLSKRKDDE